MNTNTVHQGRNIRRFREMFDMKQDALAFEMGGDWTQKRVSMLEQKEQIDRPILEEVAKALKVPVEAIEKLDDAGAINIISSSFDNSPVAYSQNQPNCTFNPLDKVVELYERILKEKDDMMAEFKKLMEKK